MASDSEIAVLREQVADGLRVIRETAKARDWAWGQAQKWKGMHEAMVERCERLANENEELRIELGKCRAALPTTEDT